MYWAEYLEEVIKEQKCLDNIKINIEDQTVELPKIVKASVFLLEKMIKNQGRNNIFVFPDNEQTPFLLMLSKVIYNILVGKIENQYSPETFKNGQILKIGKKCVTQFLEIGEDSAIPGKKLIFLKFADENRRGVPLEFAPYFQISDTKKGLSKYAAYVKAKKEINDEAKDGNKALADLKAIMTHISSSIAYVSTVADSERRASEIQINGQKLYEYLLVAKTDYLGNLHFYKGKYVGTPALVFSSQISYVNEIISNGNNVQSVIINLNECDIESQLDSLDQLLSKKIPVLCIVDTVKSLNLQELKNRNFNIWRWDADSITDSVCSAVDITAERKLRKCVSSKVNYHKLVSQDISEAFNLIYRYNRLIEDESAQMNKVYLRLIHLAYLSVRNICDVNEEECVQICLQLKECSKLLEYERSFIEQQLFYDFDKAIKIFTGIYRESRSFEKTEEIYKLLLQNRYDRFYIICSNQDNPFEVKMYWDERLAKNGYRPTIYVVYPKEFLSLNKYYADVAILSGWFSANIIKKIIYGYKVKEIHVFTYECEEKWRKAHTKSWNLGLNNENNETIVKKSFSTKIDNRPVHGNCFEELDKPDREILQQEDDLDLVVQESRYRQYTARGDIDENQIVDAKPVGFVGGDFALFTENHKILVVTKIILQNSKQVEKKEVNKLKVGDFIVVREADKDIIREVADHILEVNGKGGYRKIAALWREALKIEEAFYSVEEIYKKLLDAGCTRNYQTVRNWLQSEELIIPQDSEDLKYIAEITGDSVLAEKMNEIINAGNYIKNAHIKAGRILSERLTESIAMNLSNGNAIDPFNIWKPIEIELNEVGVVKVLKIMDIGQEFIPIESSNSNKVLAEEKEGLLWQE